MDSFQSRRCSKIVKFYEKLLKCNLWNTANRRIVSCRKGRCYIGHAYETSLSALSPTLSPPPQKKSTTNFKISFYRPSPLFPNKTRAIYFCYDNVAKRKKVFFDTVEEITATRKILTRKLSCVEENSNKNVSLKIILVERPKKLICLILCFDYLR